MSGQEIERKWLVVLTPPPDVIEAPGEAIEQGYLTDGDTGVEVRLRRRAGRCYLTAKTGRGLSRGELEVELTREQFESLWPGTEGRRLEKTRRVIETASAEVRIELDEYAGALRGLRVAEVEFSDADAARSFTPPAWFGEDVTDRDEYKNRHLALHGRPQVDE